MTGDPAGDEVRGAGGPAGAFVLALTDDWFLIPRLEDAARAQGLGLVAAGRPEALEAGGQPADRPVPLTEPLEGADAGLIRHLTARRPRLILADTACAAIPWERWIGVLKTSAATRRIPIVAFGPHVEGEALLRARRAGADRVLTRGRLHETLSQVLAELAAAPDAEALAHACAQPLPAQAREGLEQLNAGRYFEAHETLEHAWMAESGPGADLLRGLVQVAAVYLQIERRNRRGARKMLLRVRQWLDPLPTRCRGVEIGALRAGLERLGAALEAGEAPVDRALLQPVSFARDPA
jgi:predicted metal-dependent hydrolase/CheY-like chemotaxis protein